MATGLIAVTYGLTQAGTSDHGSFSVALPLVVGVLLIGAFVVRGCHLARAIIDLRLFANSTFSAASLVTLFLGIAMFGAMILILMPLYLQDVRHQDAFHTGLLLAPLGCGSALGMWQSSRTSERLGAGITSGGAGCLISAVAVVPLTRISDPILYVLLAVLMVTPQW